MDDDTLAKSYVLFSGGSDRGECAKHSKLLCKTPKLDSLSARRLIAKQLISNKHLHTGTTPKKRQKQGTIEHSLIMVPIYKKFMQGRLVSCKTKYGKWKCMDCSKFVRSSCSCTPGLMFCMDYFGNHHANLAINDPNNT